MSDNKIEYINELSVQDYNFLRTTAGWGAIKENRAATGIENSAFVVAARCGESTIGMARVISDGGYVAYIADVVVHPDYQGQGIGLALMEQVMSFNDSLLEEDHSMYSCLLSAKGKEEFYNKFGFVARPNEGRGAGMFQLRHYRGDSRDDSQEKII